MTASTDWPLARLANEARVVGPVWAGVVVGGRLGWRAEGCRTHMGLLAGGGGCALRVTEVRSSCWVGYAFVWPSSERPWADVRALTVRPSAHRDTGWWTAEEAMAAMDDLLYGRPEAAGLHVRVEPSGTLPRQGQTAI